MGKYTVEDLRRMYHDALVDAADYFAEGKEISRYIFPALGRYDDGKKMLARRQLSSRAIINPVAGDAFSVLTSGIHGRLTGQSRHWCKLEFANKSVPANSFASKWLYDAQKRLHVAWNLSNFYSVMPVYYKECSGFGNAAMFIGDSDTRLFNFELLTFGEYVFTYDANGDIDFFFRSVELTLRQMELFFGVKNLPESMQESIKDKRNQLTRHRVVHAVYRENYMDKPIKSVYFLYGSVTGNSGYGYGGSGYDSVGYYDTPLKTSGYYENPFAVSRWDVSGSDNMGVGLGSDVLPIVKRLQEKEKSFLMATHKAVNPPYNVPARLRGKTALLPGGMNYVANINEKVEPIINTGFDYQGVSKASERDEMAIRKMCFNDVFLTGMRDPNASPLKAREVDAREDEGVLRLGPHIGRIYNGGLNPLVSRCFMSMLRRGKFAPIDPQVLKDVGGINVVLIGPLAQQQKLIEVRGIQSFFQFVAGLVPFDDAARDKINIDRSIDEVADMTGVPSIILATDEEVKGARQARQAAAQDAKAKEDAVLKSQMGNESSSAASGAAKNYAAAGVDMASILSGQGGM